jgi:hypothetical protein
VQRHIEDAITSLDDIRLRIEWPAEVIKTIERIEEEDREGIKAEDILSEPDPPAAIH